MVVAQNRAALCLLLLLLPRAVRVDATTARRFRREEAALRLPLLRVFVIIIDAFRLETRRRRSASLLLAVVV